MFWVSMLEVAQNLKSRREIGLPEIGAKQLEARALLLSICGIYHMDLAPR